MKRLFLGTGLFALSLTWGCAVTEGELDPSSYENGSTGAGAYVVGGEERGVASETSKGAQQNSMQIRRVALGPSQPEAAAGDVDPTAPGSMEPSRTPESTESNPLALAADSNAASAEQGAAPKAVDPNGARNIVESSNTTKESEPETSRRIPARKTVQLPPQEDGETGEWVWCISASGDLRLVSKPGPVPWYGVAPCPTEVEVAPNTPNP